MDFALLEGFRSPGFSEKDYLEFGALVFLFCFFWTVFGNYQLFISLATPPYGNTSKFSSMETVALLFIVPPDRPKPKDKKTRPDPWPCTPPHSRYVSYGMRGKSGSEHCPLLGPRPRFTCTPLLRIHVPICRYDPLSLVSCGKR